MRLTLWFVLGLLAVSGVAAAANVEVRVGQDDPEAGVAYLRFYPPTVVIQEGDMVTWTAASHTPHTVTQVPEGAGAFDSSPALDHNSPQFQAWFGPGGFLMPSKSFTRTFNETGTVTYFCKIHPGMEGVVQVVAPRSGGTESGVPLLGGSNGSGGPGAVVHVDAGDGSGETTIDRFFPANITVEQGTTVMWTNRHSSEPHTVTSLKDASKPPSPDNVAFDSSPNVGPPPEAWFGGPQGVLSTDVPRTQFTHTFATPGTYTYICKLHPPMVGTVIVLAKPPAAGSSQMGGGAGDVSQEPPARTPGAAPLLVLGALGAAALVARRLRA